MPLAAASSTVVSLVPPATGTATPIPFGPDFEAKVMTMLITNTRFARLIAGELTEDHFLDQQNRVIAHHAIGYVNRYRSVPDPKVLVHDLVAHDRRVTAAEMPDYVRKIAEHVVRVVTDQRYVEDKLLEWAKNQALLQIMIDGPKLIAAGRSAEADRRWKKAMAIGEDTTTEAVEFFATATERRARREAVASGVIKRGVSTGFPDVDRQLRARGWERAAFSLVLAPTKRGKTMFMLQSALMSSAVYGNHNLVVSLEVSNDIATDRMDAALSGIPMDDLMDQAAAAESYVKSVAAAPTTGKLWLTRRPANTLTPAGLEGIIERHFDQGLRLDAVFVDYMGIMKTRSEYRYEDLGHISKELRRIAEVYDVAMISGYQTNRDGLAKQVSGAENMGDSFQPAQDCDLMLSLNADEAELRAGVRRITWALSRNEASCTIKVQSNMAVGRLIESIIGIVP